MNLLNLPTEIVMEIISLLETPPEKRILMINQTKPPHPMREFLGAFPDYKDYLDQRYKDYHIILRLDKETLKFAYPSFKVNQVDLKLAKIILQKSSTLPKTVYNSGSWVLYGGISKRYKLMHYSMKVGLPFCENVTSANLSLSYPLSKRLIIDTIIPDSDFKPIDNDNLIDSHSFIGDYLVFGFHFNKYYQECSLTNQMTLFDGLGINVIKENICKLGDYLSTYYKMTYSKTLGLMGLCSSNECFDTLPFSNTDTDVSNNKEIEAGFHPYAEGTSFFENITKIEAICDNSTLTLDLFEHIDLKDLEKIMKLQHQADKFATSHLLDNMNYPLFELSKFDNKSITGPISVSFKTGKFDESSYLKDAISREPINESIDEDLDHENFERLVNIVTKMNLKVLLLSYKLEKVNNILEGFDYVLNIKIRRSFLFVKKKGRELKNPLKDIVCNLLSLQENLENERTSVRRSSLKEINEILNNECEHFNTVVFKIGHSDTFEKLYLAEVQQFTEFSKCILEDLSKSRTPIPQNSNLKRVIEEFKNCFIREQMVYASIDRLQEIVDDFKKLNMDPNFSFVDGLENYLNLDRQREFYLRFYNSPRISFPLFTTNLSKLPECEVRKNRE